MAGRTPAILDSSKPYSPLSTASSHTALLVMDFQNLVVAAVPEQAESVTTVAREMRDWALSQGIFVFHCLVDTKSGAEPKPSWRMSERWPTYKEKLSSMPELGNELDELAAAGSPEKEATFSRIPGLVSALSNDEMLELLKQKQIRSLILCGISTSGCVLSTCRGSTEAGYIVTVVEDACCDPVPGLHDALMSHVIPATAHVVKFEELKKAFSNIV